MKINLKKNESINLSKITGGAQQFEFRCKWSSSSAEVVDMDIMASCKGDTNELVYYNNLKNKSGSLRLSGDSRDGSASGWDEIIYFDSSKVTSDTKRISVVIGIYDAINKGQTFGTVRDLEVEIYDVVNNKEVASFIPELTAGSSVAMILGEFVKGGADYHFKATEIGYSSVEGALTDLGYSF